MNPFGLAAFKAPRTSLFSGTSYHKLSYEMGKIIPLKFYDLAPGDHLSVDLDQLTRFAPMLAPVMHGYKLYVDAVACPYRLLYHPLNGTPVNIFNADDFFNLGVPDAQRPVVPHYTVDKIAGFVDQYYGDGDGTGTLFDYLGMPMFSDLNRIVSASFSSYLSQVSFGNHWTSSLIIVSGFYYQGLGPWTFNFFTPSSYSNKICHIMTFPEFIADRYSMPIAGTTDATTSLAEIVNFLNTNGVTLEVASIKYVNYICNEYLKVQMDPDGFDGASQPYSLLPYYVYRRIIGDWYINTNLVDISAYVRENLTLFGPTDNPFDVGNEFAVRNTLADAYYANDYFTSCFNTAQDGSQVMIPVNGSIRDLRLANRIQELKEKILYAGKRIMDQNLARFGVKPTDNRLDRCEVLNRKTFDIQISDVTQMSAGSDNNSVGKQANFLGSYAGQGFGLGRQSSFINYTASENTMVMILISLRPQAVYDGQINKLYFKTSPYDFLAPEVAQVGEQTVLKNELYPHLSAGYDNAVFGYQRRYAEYMFEPSTIGGAFHNSMDYWTGARQFNDHDVVFNDQFAKITDADNFNRIFAVPEADEHIYSFFGLSWKCTVLYHVI